MFAFTRFKKSDHLLADPRATRELIEQISQRDGSVRLEGLTEVLDSLKTAQDLGALRVFEVADQLDRVGRPYWRKATQDYFAGNGKLTNYQITRLWTMVGEYLVQLAEAYEYCLARMDTASGDLSTLGPQLPRIIGRALRLRGAAQSWDYVRYANHFGRWGEIYRLYRIATARGCLDQQMALYRGGRLCTIEQELMQVLMLAVAAPQSLLPEQIDVADRISARLAYAFSLAGDAKDNRYYFFDPASSSPPSREQPGIRPPITARRFGPGDARTELKGLAARAARGELPLSEIGVDRHSVEIVAPTVQHLVRHWCDAPPERRFARRRAPQRIEVAHGFEEIVAKVGNLPSAYPFASAREIWLIENAGEGGIGVLAALPHGAWASVGGLVALRYPEAGVWNLAIVRHINEDKEDRFLGLEVVSKGGVAVSLHRHRRTRADEDEDYYGVWLAGNASTDNVITLLLPRGSFAKSRSLYMYLQGREYVLKPLEQLASGADYDIGRYEVRVEDRPAGRAK